MPEGTDAAGDLRTFEVVIAGASYHPPDASSVRVQLEKSLAEWNEVAERLPVERRELRIHHLSKFHHELLKIHPFTDGNGALARTLLSMQLSTLFGRTRPVVFSDRDRYFEALINADEGDLSLLETLVAEFAEDVDRN